MPKSDDKVDTSAADAAVAETVAKPADLIEFEFEGATYSFRRKRLNSVTFRLAIQRGNDVVALEYLLGAEQFNSLVEANADEDGDMDRDQLRGVYDALSDAAGSGKSSTSSRR